MVSSLAVRLVALASVAVAEQRGFLATSSNATIENLSATFGDGANFTQFDRPAVTEEAEMGCVDTYDWDNGYSDCAKESYDPGMCTAADAPTGGWTCAAYVAKGWCREDRCLGPDETHGVYACGAKLNYPERNCCACGGGSSANIEAASLSCKPIGSSCDRDDECCPDGAGGPPMCSDMGYGKECISP